MRDSKDAVLLNRLECVTSYISRFTWPINSAWRRRLVGWRDATAVFGETASCPMHQTPTTSAGDFERKGSWEPFLNPFIIICARAFWCRPSRFGEKKRRIPWLGPIRICVGCYKWCFSYTLLKKNHDFSKTAIHWGISWSVLNWSNPNL